MRTSTKYARNIMLELFWNYSSSINFSVIEESDISEKPLETESAFGICSRWVKVIQAHLIMLNLKSGYFSWVYIWKYEICKISFFYSRPFWKRRCVFIGGAWAVKYFFLRDPSVCSQQLLQCQLLRILSLISQITNGLLFNRNP